MESVMCSFLSLCVCCVKFFDLLNKALERRKLVPCGETSNSFSGIYYFLHIFLLLTEK